MENPAPPPDPQTGSRSAPSHAPVAIVVMGVSGSGKSSLGKALADMRQVPFLEGDSLHSGSSIAKMAAGKPLDDADRAPWLARIADAANTCTGPEIILACSALKRSYRDFLRDTIERRVIFVFLKGSRATLEARLAARTEHFMAPALLDSQLATLESPEGEADVIVLSPETPLAAQTQQANTALSALLQLAFIPAWRELPWEDPWDLARRLGHKRHLMFLDSAPGHGSLGRYAAVACEPVSTLSGDSADVLTRLDAGLALHHTATLVGLPPFQGGFAGYIAYEFGRALEPCLAAALPPPAITPFMLHAYDVVFTADVQERRLFVVSNGCPESDLPLRSARAVRRLEEALGWLEEPPVAPPPAPCAPVTRWQSNFTRPAYEAAVARVREDILAGDIFQANLSQEFSGSLPAGFSPMDFYAALRVRNAAPFSAFLDFGDVVIASASPERLVSLRARKAEARPIKGTRRRDTDPDTDGALAADLLASAKDRAENTMIVDLLRNDLSRVCQPGSIHVPVLCGLETYATVHHLVSVVTGTLEAGCSVGDLIGACFPGGSITGAPKARAMEIIAREEAIPRNIYCGSIGYAGFNGNADFSIAIRTVLFHQGVARFSGGGGITARSDPADEYEETLTKVARIRDVFENP